jgi:hypothetical protein
MKKLLLTMTIIIAAAGSAQGDLTLPDGTVTADTWYEGHGLYCYWAESVTTLTIDAQNLDAGQYIQVSGKITDISHPSTSWAEIGLIPKDRYDYWQTAFGGGWEAAVFDKGLYVVHWDNGESELGLALKEGWDDLSSTTYHNTAGDTNPYALDLAAPTTGDPWEFSFKMHPTTSGNAYLSVTGETVYGTQPFVYGVDDGNPVSNDNDYSECYLIAQIWSNTENGSFSFVDVEATVVPTPAAVLLGILGLGAVGIKLRKFA